MNGSVYVLPGAVAISAPAETMSATVDAEDDEVLQMFAPPSPPPKGSLL